MNSRTGQVSEPLLSVEDLSIVFGREEEANQVVHNVGFQIKRGEKLALVGESGSGKSVTALSILKLLDATAASYPCGRINFEGQNLLAMSIGEIRKIRGKEIAMIFQEPMTSLNPVYPIGDQLIEPLLVHQGLSKDKARKRMIELLDRTGIPEPQKRIDAFPHMLSGGQRQRVMIAMALSCNPKLLIADEPTTALDVTIQLQILKLLEELQQEFNMSVLMITHDLNLVRRFADNICVMQNGRIVERASVNALFDAPQHPYTQRLLASQPEQMNLESMSSFSTSQYLMQGKQINCEFEIKSGFFRRKIGSVKAVDNIDIHIRAGETLGLVGESGSGKTTLGMCLLRLQACSGDVYFQDKQIDLLTSRQLRHLRRHFQVVFQDPYSSLSPRMTVEQIVGEGLKIHFPELTAAQRRARIIEAMNEVGLESEMIFRYPHEFSGGQRQRIAIARAVILEPQLILLDEPTSALDVSVQKQVLELLKDLQTRHKISYLFITHDLKVIRAMAHRIVVMKQGQVVEEGETERLFKSPHQEYTKTLLQASLFTETV
jgi:microcin C transport system ATP-binding protein